MIIVFTSRKYTTFVAGTELLSVTFSETVMVVLLLWF